MELLVTRAAIEDAGAILMLQKLAYRSEARLYNDWSLPPLIQTLEELQAEFGQQVILKALADGRIIGSVRAQMSDPLTCAIGRLMVHPDYQGQGIGTRLMQEVERHFDQAERFELFTGHKSARNLRFYERLGYRELRREPVTPELTLVYLEKLKKMPAAQLASLHRLAASVVESAAVLPGGQIPGWTNTTGCTLRLPGGNRGYPAFWVRDAAMMLGADFIPAPEVEGWVRLIASVQPGPEGIHLKHGLFVPAYSMPDHITLKGTACWYPGAMDGEDQGNGTFGFLPPADDAFYFIQMVREHWRLTGKPSLFEAEVKTGWGTAPLAQVCVHAFESVAADPDCLVVCEAAPGKTRVDWGFCDTVRKTGRCLMPSLLRWHAARDLEALFRATGDTHSAERFAREATRVQKSIPRVFSRPVEPARGPEDRLLLSATGLGAKEDVWASAYAVWSGVLPDRLEKRLADRLLALYRQGGTVREGHVRHLPPAGPFSGFWEQTVAAPGKYQNGAFWGTPTGWYVAALSKVDRAAAEEMLAQFLAHLEVNRDRGAPWECFNPALDHYQNPLYCATVALPFISMAALEPGL